MTLNKYLLFFIFILFSANTLHSQNKNFSFSLSHSLNNSNEKFILNPKDYISGSDSFKVVAILVQFQEDNDDRTTGNGKFDLSNKYYNPVTQKDTVIDAPPYDSAYFADHLKFLKNYYNKSSKGKLNISYDLFGRVVTLPNKMEAYSPQRNENNLKLGNLFQDSWAVADSFINFSNYDLTRTAFVIFHAGVGRDIDLSSVLGYDPTPYDIPSVFLGLKNLREVFGNNYSGFQTNDGVFISNSMIIPSTELRELQLLSGNTLIELGINGLLAASFGSYLGLPDLFNTSNGKTAIGRFGLMDGQSLFSYNGIFPPEPSAWEKIYLGWISPVVISSGSGIFKIPTSSKTIQRDTSVYKVLISSKEYFLIENRNRDPENNGQIIYSRNRETNSADTYTQDLEDGFYYSSQYTSLYKLNGNVTDVENFDWSLPGLINNDYGYKGGILIWHIDENIIESKISSNSINNDINHKGVDLEEAKGAQEIGVTFNTPFGAITGDGTAVDYWYNGYHEVPTTIYKNTFSPTSNPNSLSYSLTNNNIFITDFSTIDTLMTFKFSIGNNLLQPLKGFPKFTGIDSAGNSQAIAFDFNSSNGDEIFVNSGNKTYGFRYDGSAITGNGIISEQYGKFIPSMITSGENKYLVSTKDFGIQFIDNNLSASVINWSNSPVSTSPLINNNLKNVYIGKSNGTVTRYRIDLSGLRIDSASSSINQFAETPADTFTYIVSPDKYLVTGNITASNSFDKLTVNNNNEFFINGNKLNLNYTISALNSSPVLADVNNDGKQEIIFVGNNKLYAVNSGGVLLDNFPVDFNNQISSGISVADVNNDNIFDVLFATTNGDLYAYSVSGKVVDGFPVSIGPNTLSTPALADLNDTLGILVVSGDGYLYGFKTNSLYNESKILWKNYLKDEFLSNNNRVSGNNPVVYSEKLPSDRVYNWPNPVYDESTFLRYYLNGNASSVIVKVLDLSGELVTNLPGTMISNSDNEVKWNVSEVQSGIYYGVIEAVIDGSKETKIIKIAVIK